MNDMTPQAPIPMPQPTNSAPTPPNQPSNTVVMSVLAYISILVLIPLLAAKDDPVVKFHIRQGLVLFIMQVGLWAIGNYAWMFLGMFYPLLNLINLGILVLAIIGIVNAVKKQEKELPLVGGLAQHLPI